MRILLLLLVILAVLALNARCFAGFSAQRLNEPFSEPKKGSAGSVHVSVWDGSSEHDAPHIKGQTALVNAVMTFGSYWADVLQNTRTDEGSQPLGALVYQDFKLGNIMHKSVPREVSSSAKIRYTLGSFPQAEVYEFRVPVLVGATSHRLGEKLAPGEPGEADHQRYIIELICRPDVPPVLRMTTRQQFIDYIRDYIKTNVAPFITCTDEKLIPYSPEMPLFQFQFVE
jgi:hypothetical protein